MLDELACTCEASDCNRHLDEADCQLVYCTEGGERRAYECDCGHVTVTVVR